MIISIGKLESFGKKISQILKLGCPLFLYGELGVGKTTLARSIIQSMAPHIGYIPSPSFPILLPYDTPQGLVWHCDLYRIKDPSEVEAIGLKELMATSFTLIEWPERLGPCTPALYWSCSLLFTAHDTEREAVLSSPMKEFLF